MTERRIRTGSVTPGTIPAAAVQALRDRLHRIDGGHVLWQGVAMKGTTPVLYVDNIVYPARPLAWSLHHGAEPVGLVKVGCGTRLCMHVPHLTDRATRQREHHLYAALHGVILTGPCAAGAHDLAEYGRVRSTGLTECQGCNNDSRRLTPSHPHEEGAQAA